MNIPEGFKLVPVEPTPEMRHAFHDSYDSYESGDGECCPDSQWAAMLAAAPVPPQEHASASSATKCGVCGQGAWGCNEGGCHYLESGNGEPTQAQCCTPTPEELAALAEGDCTPEELWGGSRPTCPKCFGAGSVPKRLPGEGEAAYRARCKTAALVPPQADAQPVGRVSYIGNGFVRVRLTGAPPKLECPLYTHADAGEVERLRAALRTEVEAGDSWKREADTLRAQLASAEREISFQKSEAKIAQDTAALGVKLLAERDALLNRAYDLGYIDGDWVDAYRALSASAEPATFAGMKVVADPALAPDEIRIVHPKP